MKEKALVIWQKVVEFCKAHKRNVLSVAVILVLVILVVITAAVRGSGDKKTPADQTDDNTALTDENGNPIQPIALEKNAIPQIDELINNYYTAYAAGDMAALENCATPITETEKSFITMYSKHVPRYDTLTCYTEQGADAAPYLVSVSYDMYLTDVKTPAPGLSFFYVKVRDDGAYYIDNTYSQFNLANQETSLDADVANQIAAYQQQPVVIALQKNVQDAYDNALSSDEQLKKAVEETLPQAFSEWVAGLQPSQGEQAAAPPQEPAADTPPAEQPAAETPPAETPAPPADPLAVGTVLTMHVTDGLKLRGSKDEGTDNNILDAAWLNTQVKIISGNEDGWTQVELNGKTGYMRTDYLLKEAQ